MMARKKLNNDSKFATFYISVISVALCASLYVNRLNGGWKRVVFTFPLEVQKVVENGTAVMEVQWRWLPDTFEMIVKVNDDDSVVKYSSWGFCFGDRLGILFDSDHNGNLSREAGEKWNDHGVFLFPDNASAVIEYCWVCPEAPYFFYQGAVTDSCACYGPCPRPDIIAMNLTGCYSLYKEGEGYTFILSIPRNLIDVSPPTPIHISFTDYDRICKESDDFHPIPHTYQTTIAASLTG